MSTSREFHYRLPRRSGGWRPGSHPGSSLGAGQEFVSHVSLLRPAGSTPAGSSRQPARSARRLAGSNQSPAGQCAGPRHRRCFHIDELRLSQIEAARRGRLRDSARAQRLPRRRCARHACVRCSVSAPTCSYAGAVEPRRRRSDGVRCWPAAKVQRGVAMDWRKPALHLGRTPRLDLPRFRLPLAAGSFGWRARSARHTLHRAAHHLGPGRDPASETRRPLPLRDMESGRRSTVWLRPSMRARWQEAVERRRAELNAIFTARGIRPFYINGEFDSEALSHYFFEATA